MERCASCRMIAGARGISATRLAAFLEAVRLGAGQGIKDHDRWRLARRLLERKLSGRRKHSKLPALVDLVLARPLVPAGMIAAELGMHGPGRPGPCRRVGITGDNRARALSRLGHSLSDDNGLNARPVTKRLDPAEAGAVRAAPHPRSIAPSVQVRS